MAIYKVQGPNGEIITIEGPDGADPNDVIAQAQTLYKPKEKTATDYAKDFGKATASLADTGLNAVTGMIDYAAYPLARAFGRSPEQATQETTSPKDIIGSAFGITQDPAYQSELSRRMMTGMGQGIENYAVKPLASATGLPEQDVNSMVGSAMLGAGAKAQPYINRAGQKVAQGIYNAEPYIKSAITTPTKGVFYDFPKGVIEGLVNKEYNPATSAMVPLRDTYTPPPAAERFMGQAKTPPYKIGEGPSSGPLPNMPEQSLSQLESQARPTSELVGDRVGQLAQKISPKTLAGETLVPLQGQGMQAWGERVGRGARTNPLQAMGEIALTSLTGIPFKTALQGIGELGARYLGAKTGFMPGFSEKVGQAQARTALQPNTPLLTNNPTAPGPVNPSTMFVSPEGVAGTNINQVSQAGAQQKYAPQPVAQPAGPTPQQMAVQKTQEIVAQQAPTRTPQQQAILDQIRARGNNPPVPTTPVSGPVSPASIQSLPTERWTPAEKLALERANLQNNPPPTITAADEAAMAKQAIESQKATNSEIISQHARGNIMGETTSIDTGKDAYNGSNATQGKAKALEKAGVDSLPIVNGMTDAQVIDALHTEMFGKKTKSPFTPEARTTKQNKMNEETSFEEQLRLSTEEGKAILSADKKTITHKGEDNFDGQPEISSYANKNIKWDTENLHYDDKGNLVKISYISAENKKGPMYKLEEHYTGNADTILYKKESGKDWTEIKTSTEPPEKDYSQVKVLDKPATFKPDSSISILTRKDNADSSITMTGTKNGKPITIEFLDMDKGGYVKIYDENKNLIQEYDKNGKPVKTLNQNLFTEGKAPKNVSQMMIDEPKATGPLEQSLVSKRSFNGDLQKYRYGTEKSPLTLEEYNHLKNSEFIDKQNTRDILMGMRPDLTEYSIWYKDKSGKIQNIQTYGNEFKKK